MVSVPPFSVDLIFPGFQCRYAAFEIFISDRQRLDFRLDTFARGGPDYLISPRFSHAKFVRDACPFPATNKHPTSICRSNKWAAGPAGLADMLKVNFDLSEWCDSNDELF